MPLYCITAAKHEDSHNHLNSKFKLWKYNEDKEIWKCLDWKDAFYIINLLQEPQSTVLTGKYDDKAQKLSYGAPVELEFRIAKNESKYKINDMPKE
jgi:hypothetical protein